MEVGVLDWWRQGRAKRRLGGEARHLIREAQRILKRKNFRIPQAVADQVRAAVTELETALNGDDLDRTRNALSDLDHALEDKLAFARKSTIREYSESIGIAVAIALLLRAFVVEAFQIPSGSMIPTLEVGDHIFVAKFSYGLVVPFSNKKIFEFHQPNRGDVIVFKYPQDPSIDYIKRVVGLPGETVELRHNEVFINNRPMPRERVGPYHGSPDERDSDSELWHETLDGKQHEALQDGNRAPQNYGPIVVPEGNVFVMGDNRDNSSDSRVWGTVAHDLIKGRALVVWWSRGTPEETPWYAKPVAWLKSIRFGRFFHRVN
jgi:signal peptidase I